MDSILTDPIKETASSSTKDSIDDIHHKIKYFNLNFTEASGSSCQAVMETSPSFKAGKIGDNNAKALAYDFLQSTKLFDKNPPEKQTFTLQNKFFNSNPMKPRFENCFGKSPNPNLTTLTEGMICSVNPTAKNFQANHPAEGEIKLAKEMTLQEIGFGSTQIEDWDKIVQPHKEHLITLLKNMIENYIKTNVVIRIGDKSFNCHMMVLQCYSSFFMNLNNEQIIYLPADKVSQEAFVMIYDWMLSPEPKVQREGILELFTAAQFLKMKALVDQCWVCLDDDERFCEDAAFLLYMEARTYKLDLIMQLMLTRICKFFLTLVSSREFLELDHKEVCTLLKSNSIGVNSESEVLMVAVRWLSYDWRNRKDHLLEMISCVRFGLMPPWLLVGLRRNQHCNELQRVLDNADVIKMIDDGLSYVLTKGYYYKTSDNYFNCLERFNLTEPQQRQWICDDSCVYHHKNQCPNAKYITYETFLQYLEMIRSFGKDHWKKLQTRNEEEPNTELEDDRNHNSSGDEKEEQTQNHNTPDAEACVSSSRKFVTSCCSTREAYETISQQLERMINKRPKPLDSQECCHNGATELDHNLHRKIGILRKPVLNDKILVFGGIDPYSCPKTIEGQGIDILHFDIFLNNWKRFSAMPGSKHHHSVAVVNKLVYVMGGTRLDCKRLCKPEDPPRGDNVNFSQTLSKDLWCFNPRILEWSEGKDLLSPRRDFALIVYHHGLFVIGGEGPNGIIESSVHYYNTIEDKWFEKKPLNIPRTGLCAALIDNEIWVAGGLAGRKNDGSAVITDSVEVYNISLNTWTKVCHLRIPRAFARMCVKDHNMYVIGGLTYVKERKYFLSLDSIDKYSFNSKEWKIVARLNTPRHGHDVVVLQDSIYILGGVCNQRSCSLSSIECLNVNGDSSIWIENVKPLPSPLSGLAVVEVP